MSEIVIGSMKTPGGTSQVGLDVEHLVVTRALVTANSGGGKSYLLRKIFEGVGETTQLIVLDREGEFVTLREQLDLVIVGPDGEIPTEVRTARLLVRRLMEKRLSAVIDMSDLPLEQQRQYVRLFLGALIELPKSLWQPCFFGLDETHLFAPEKGRAESSEAVVNLATLGRKRGYAAIFATQRISKFNKDAAAELLNKFIGRTTLDVDRKRAADELGIDNDEGRKLRDLSPPGREGEFHAFGPALTQHSGLLPGVNLIRVGAVATTHPKAGQGRMLAPPKPSSAITAILGEFKDLAKQADAEVRDIADARAKIAQLERELKRRPTTAAPVQQQPKREAAELARLREGLKQAMAMIEELQNQEQEGSGVDAAQLRSILEAAGAKIVALVEQAAQRRTAGVRKFKSEAGHLVGRLQRLLGDDAPPTPGDPAPEPAATRPPASSQITRSSARRQGGDVAQVAGLKAGAVRMLMASVTLEQPTRASVARLADMKKGGGTWSDYVRALTVGGYWQESEDDGRIQVTPKGRAAVDGVAKPTPTNTREVVALWAPVLKAGARRMLDAIVVHRSLTRHQLAAHGGVAEGSGTFSDYMRHLIDCGLVMGGRSQPKITAAPALLLEDA